MPAYEYVCKDCNHEVTASLACKEFEAKPKIKCPHCQSDNLQKKLSEFTGQEKRKCRREKTNILTKFENNDLFIVNMGDNNIGFLSDYLFSVNEERLLKIRKNDTEQVIKFKITRPTNSDRNYTGYNYFYGAEILGAEILGAKMLYRKNINR
jgi:putative FmdB family regulatory protein